ncbi:splicing factor, arginine/serine-rich 19-like [Pollicipes pollicipes]|uniref:splicing factor, arginine/serine-rich 19-like n=1 Tax=Pollicipes pollicipes TaxID=41117 RepID=UPI001884A2D6|nr:splicing factor, arginine/serine-rich 19-like [Pollicipes pollicipes]
MDIDSPYSPDSPNSPDSREGDDLFEPPRPARGAPPPAGRSRRMDPKDRFEALFGTSHAKGAGKAPPGKTAGKAAPSGRRPAARARPAKRPAGKGGSSTATSAAAEGEEGLKVIDDVPNSAVEMQVKEKFLKKLNRQERVIEEVKLVLKPFYHKRTVTKEQYKEILRKSVPKICHSKSGEINPKKIHSLIISYVKKCKYVNKKNNVVVPNANSSTPAKTKV